MSLEAALQSSCYTPQGRRAVLTHLAMCTQKGYESTAALLAPTS